MFPFGLLSNDYINNTNSSTSMHKLDMIPEFEMTSTSLKLMIFALTILNTIYQIT